jgi:hypothetical protein
MNLIYYVTSHGYGHGVRTVAICNAFSPDVRITFRTTLPEAFFREEMRRDFAYEPASFDCGCVQKDGITTAIEQTLMTYRKIARENEPLLDQEVRWCRDRGADIIASDITPFAFDVARGCGIPSVAVTNFTWYDIYEEYVRLFPEYAPDLEKIRSQYASATLALALDPALPMPFFKKQKAVPPVGRSGRNRRAEIVRKYGLGPDKHLGLVYFGHYGMSRIDWRKLSDFSGWEFFGVCDLPGAPSNYRCIPKSDFPYEDLAASADCMVGKIGYGAVAEAMLHGTPMLYLPRENFAEYPTLDASVRSWGGGYPLSTAAFLSLDWKETLAAVVKNGRPEPVRSDGARICAETIEGLDK